MGHARLVTTEVVSNDGTKIAFDSTGDGPPLILIAGALSDRASHAPLVELLAPEFTVFNYDRRGRGDSGDTPPYAVERETEDLDVIIGTVGELVLLYGSSSGGNLALRAALRNLNIRGLALWEPNFIVDHSRPPLPTDYVEHLNALVAAGRRGDAVAYFMTTAVGMPAEFVAPMRDAPFWPAQDALAHTRLRRSGDRRQHVRQVVEGGRVGVGGGADADSRRRHHAVDDRRRRRARDRRTACRAAHARRADPRRRP
jgi:alpha-beta hydrolase superfamily lysophospholipase